MKIVDFIIKDAEPDWPQEKLQAIQEKLKQRNLFDEQDSTTSSPCTNFPINSPIGFSMMQVLKAL